MSLIEETIAILKSRGCTFATASETGALARGRRSRIDYLREYAEWQSSSGGLRFPLWLLRRVRNRTIRHSMRPAPAPIGQPQVFLQHDADRNPQNTIKVMELEARLGVRSSCYFFVTRAPRGTSDDEPYPVDWQRLAALERQGFEIGYHLNAPELEGYERGRTMTRIASDLAFFRSRVRLRSFVPHGGVPGPRGENNERIQHPRGAEDLVWFYCGKGVSTDVVWSDGHVESEASDSLPDPRVVAASLRGRVRARFLFHPQYYGDRLRENLSNVGVTRTDWWRSLWPSANNHVN